MRIACPRCESVNTLPQVTINEILATGAGRLSCASCGRSYPLPSAVIDRVRQRAEPVPPPLPARPPVQPHRMAAPQAAYAMQPRYPRPPQGNPGLLSLFFGLALVIAAVLGLLALGRVVAGGTTHDPSAAIGDMVPFLGIIALGIAVFVVYLLPTWVAVARNHHNAMAIAAVNILFGWTFLGWGIAMVWSLTAVRH